MFLESQRNIGTKTNFAFRQESFGSDEHKHVSKSILFVLSKTQAQEPRIIF